MTAQLSRGAEQNPTSVSQENPATSSSFSLGVAQGVRAQREEAAAGLYVGEH